MKKNAIEPATIRALPPGEYADGGGLYLIVTKHGSRSWMFKYQWPVTDEHGVTKNKTLKIGLGSVDAVAGSAKKGREATSLKKARELAETSRANVRAKRDPKVYRPQYDDEEVEKLKLKLRSSPEFLAFAKKAITGYIANQKPRSQDKWWRSINHYCKALHTKKVGDITTQDVLDVLSPLWLAKPAAARCCRMHLAHVLDQARIAGHRPENERNPSSLDGHLEKMLPRQPRKGRVRGSHPALDYRQAPTFMAELRRRQAETRQLAATMLEVTILTGVRTKEVLQMQWSQLDLDGTENEHAVPLWTIPAEVMKNSEMVADPKPGLIPLTPRVVAIVRQLADLDLDPIYVFPSSIKRGEPMSNMTMLKMLQQDMGYDGERKPLCTVHGFRTTFRTWGQESMDPRFEKDILEMCLHHLEGNATVAAYARGDCIAKRREALTHWAAFCDGKRPAPALQLVA